MADSDPISDATPHKKRKLNNGKAWDSQEDSGEELTEQDFCTEATLPLPSTQQRRLPTTQTQPTQLQYTSEQFHNDIRNDNQTYVTQPTQTLNANTQPRAIDELPSTSDVLVEHSSPTRAPSPPKVPPQPIRRAFTSKPTSLVRSSIAPPGTALRLPPNVQPKPKQHVIDLDSDEDPPVHHSSDEEADNTRSMTSTLRPTNFKKGGKGLDSESSNIVKESPRAIDKSPSTFQNLLQGFKYNDNFPSNHTNDMIGAYAGTSRQPRPQQASTPRLPASKPQPSTLFRSLDDIHDSRLKEKVRDIQRTLPHESVQRCVDALKRKNGNVGDAMNWLLADEEKDASGEEIDELASMSPVAKRGVAMPSKPLLDSSSQPVRKYTAKQELQVPTRSIADRYFEKNSTIDNEVQSPQSPEEERIRPAQRKRLQQGRRGNRSPSPFSSSPASRAPQPPQRAKQVIIVDDDDDSDADSGVEEIKVPEEVAQDSESEFDRRLLKFFNECTVEQLVDLSAQQPETIKAVLAQRPFESLDVIRTISDKPDTTKSGKRSRARPVGDRIVDVCAEMWTGYDAVDELVEECDRIAKPIQQALKGWGTGSVNEDGELRMLNLDEAHDSGIGTPSSSGPSSPPLRAKQKGFLAQPESMNTEFTLKDYQLVGLNWLNLLWTKKVSCILADDMGLGKTCQVIAFLAHLQEQRVDGLHLIVVPGSTLENWLMEFQRFAPKLKVVPYYAPQKDRETLRYNIQEEIDTIDVIVTTYDMAVKPVDNKFLRHLQPLVCVYDEAHALRNTTSDRYKWLMKIPADFRLLLTGTPLQNNLRELVAILAFIMPALFQEKQEALEYIFQHKASTKDTDSGALLLSTERIARARTMMTPFILRRKKQQVLELPAKHSRVEYCDMTSSQTGYYASVLEEAQDFFAQAGTAKKGKKTSTNILMKLRKAAIDKMLSRHLYDDAKIDKMVEELVKHEEFSANSPEKVKQYLTGEHHQSENGGDYWLHRFCCERPYLRKFQLKKKHLADSSGKIQKFRELVQAFVDNGDRILVFSQFTSMMDILEYVLNEMDVKFMRLDGSTAIQSRQTMLNQFTNDTTIPVFMLSTKAGGAGINLACANKVIIFDSGFNPQDDVQAENRAHRVGQTREVEVVRLVTKGTIEEQIHALGESKLALDERVAGENIEDGKADEDGKAKVEKMFLESLKGGGEAKSIKAEPKADLVDDFKKGLESAGLKVASKQAQF